MSEEIIKIFSDYKNIGANEDFAIKISEILLSEFGLENFVKDIKMYNNFCYNIKNSYGNFDCENQNININLHSIRSVSLWKNRYRDVKILNNSDKKLYLMLMTYSTIRHELEHAIQYKKLLNNDDSIESKLCEISFYSALYDLDETKLIELINVGYSAIEISDLIDSFSSNYQKCYYSIYAEKSAFIESEKDVYNIAINENIKNKKLSLLFKRRFLEYWFMGYSKKDDKIICPSYTFPKVLGLPHMLNNIEIYSENDEEALNNAMECYNFEERIKLGLPINENEYQRILEIKKANYIR